MDYLLELLIVAGHSVLKQSMGTTYNPGVGAGRAEEGGRAARAKERPVWEDLKPST
jgi:hypothetical protein